MMGRLPVGQNELFYEFCIEDHVPQKHVLRALDRFLDFTEVRTHLTAYYSDIGRPSIDPELMIRMLLVGYCFGIRSERRLCEEVHLNLAYRWFCRLGVCAAEVLSPEWAVAEPSFRPDHHQPQRRPDQRDEARVVARKEAARARRSDAASISPAPHRSTLPGAILPACQPLG